MQRNRAAQPFIPLFGVLPALLGLALTLAPRTSFAQATLKVFGTGAYQYNSNVFDVSGPAPIPGTNDYRHGDSYYAYGAGFDFDRPRGWQDVFLNGVVTDFHYDHFSQLTHTEYKLDGGLRWHLGVHINGNVEASRTRSMVSFLQVAQSQLATTTEQREAANATVLLSSRWSLDGSAATRTVDEPLVEAPNLRLKETQVGTTLKYLGVVGLTSGASLQFQHGKFDNTNGTVNPAYDQENASFVLNYAPSSRQSFDGAVGYSHRTSASDLDNFSGVTGHVEYVRSLTPKTSVSLTAGRNVFNYLTNAGTEVDTVAAFTLNYRATYKTSASIGYNWTIAQFPDQGFMGVSNREDHIEYTSLIINYRALDWLTVRPYANVQTRSSNLPGTSFNSTVFGANLVVTWQRGSGKAAKP